jgi:tRNA dimethylallyltransferase
VPSPEVFRNALVLTGPTGSGKSALALEQAERLGAEIIAMDSMTLYKGMDIGTAKPTPEDRRRVPHHLIDVLEPWESGNVAWWLSRAAACVRDIESRGKRALFVGGTPLYLKALLFGLFDGPPADDAVRAKLTAFADAHGPAALHDRLAAVDPVAAARLHPNDVKRVTRALEVWDLTGRPISDWQREWSRSPLSPGGSRAGREGELSTQYSVPRTPSPPATLSPGQSGDRVLPRVVCLDRPRAELYARIDRRVLDMLAAGWLDEVRRLRALRRPRSREAAAAVGYRELNDFLDSRLGWDEAVERAQRRSRNYAKHQLTWFRRLPGLRFVTGELTTAPWE